jgi:predicted peptidase
VGRGWLAFLLCAVSCVGTTPPPAAVSATIPADTFEANVFQSSSGVTLPYRLLRPAGGPADGPYPLVVIFHGSGAIGTDNRSQIGAVAKSWATDDARRELPAFVLVPQFPARSANYTIGADSLPYSEGTALLGAGVELIHHIRATENVDRERTWAVGFSMGGSAIWNVLRGEPGLFARAVIVGGVPAADAVRAIGNTRVLLVHGDEDTENPFAAAWNVYLASNGTIDFWRFPGLGHEFPPELITSGRIREWLARNTSGTTPARDDRRQRRR